MPSTEPSSWREHFLRERPEFPWLDPEHPESVETFLRDREFLAQGERLVNCSVAGPGNMNLTLRIETSKRSFVLKQSRPWVEKYEHIRAPWDRDSAERQFYEFAAGKTEIRSRIPALLGSDPAAHVLLIEDIAGARDLSALYQNEGERIADIEIDELSGFLAVLHGQSLDAFDLEFSNESMRKLNFAHLFEVPFDEKNGVDLEGIEPGLLRQAQYFRSDTALRRAVMEAGARYMAVEPSLLHGDFFPGSWLRTPRGMRIIDFEFSFRGPPEIDIGCAIAHLALGGQTIEAAERFITSYRQSANDARIDASWIGRFAGIEVARRLIGVAQLPLATDSSGAGRRCDLLRRARLAILECGTESLFEAAA